MADPFDDFVESLIGKTKGSGTKVKYFPGKKARQARQYLAEGHLAVGDVLRDVAPEPVQTAMDVIRPRGGGNILGSKKAVSGRPSPARKTDESETPKVAQPLRKSAKPPSKPQLIQTGEKKETALMENPLFRATRTPRTPARAPMSSSGDKPKSVETETEDFEEVADSDALVRPPPTTSRRPTREEQRKAMAQREATRLKKLQEERKAREQAPASASAPAPASAPAKRSFFTDDDDDDDDVEDPVKKVMEQREREAKEEAEKKEQRKRIQADIDQLEGDLRKREERDRRVERDTSVYLTADGRLSEAGRDEIRRWVRNISFDPASLNDTPFDIIKSIKEQIDGRKNSIDVEEKGKVVRSIPLDFSLEGLPDATIKEITKILESSIGETGKAKDINERLTELYDKLNKTRKGRGMRKLKGGAPPQKAYFQSAEGAYEPNAPKVLSGDFSLVMDSPTFDAYVNDNAKEVLIAPRGTDPKSFEDLKADGSLAFNQLRNSRRYARDKTMFIKLTQQFPPEQYSYYASGHSLSGAIITQLRRDYPFIKMGVAYNSAFQPQDLITQDPTIRRIYTDKDFLYNLGGKFFRNIQVIPMKQEQATGFFGKLKQKLTPSGLQGHSLSNFKPLYGGQECSTGTGIGADIMKLATGQVKSKDLGSHISQVAKSVKQLKGKGILEDIGDKIGRTIKAYKKAIELPGEIKRNLTAIREQKKSAVGMGSSSPPDGNKKIDFGVIKWGTFDDLHKRYLKKHPKSDLTDLKAFAKHIVANKGDFSQKAFRKANFYIHILNPDKK